jgi:hypothetical protein
MIEFWTDTAGIAMMVGVLSIYYGLSMYKWRGQTWKVIAAPLAVLGVFETGFAFAVYIDTIMGLLAIGLFGSLVCFALFRIGQENS